jgi:hypothetical protein
MTSASHPIAHSPLWRSSLLLTLAFWLSGSLLLDGLVMPTMYAAGMMVAPGFASAGYSLFWLFNRVELVCAAVILTDVLLLRYLRHPWHRPGQFTLWAPMLLLAIALLDTYAFTPVMSSLGLSLNWFVPTAEPPALMNQLHLGYWLLEIAKLSLSGLLLWVYSRKAFAISEL